MLKVLDVGNCNPDHASISRLLTSSFNVQVLRADNAAQTMAILATEPVGLILVNRKIDEDYSDGIEIIKQLKAEPKFASIPVMLITNYEEHQEQAMELGAIRGFGKLSLSSPDTISRLRQVLEP
jgi:response regulator RpfG family c-di-GMP phosphodiesterase